MENVRPPLRGLLLQKAGSGLPHAYLLPFTAASPISSAHANHRKVLSGIRTQLLFLPFLASRPLPLLSSKKNPPPPYTRTSPNHFHPVNPPCRAYLKRSRKEKRRNAPQTLTFSKKKKTRKTNPHFPFFSRTGYRH